jgi:cytoskeletal protein CcmA (bactofilin family)
MFEKFKGHPVGHIIESSLNEERFAKRAKLAHITEQEKAEGSTLAEAVSSISSGLSIVGKIVGSGKLAIFGHVEGEVHASTVQIGDGAQVEGNIIAEELTIDGRVKGTIRANRVKLNSNAVVEGDIYHRSLAIEESAQFEGMSRRQENVVDTPSLVLAKRSLAQAINIDDGASDSLKPSQTQAAPIDRKGRSNTRSNVPNP